MSETRDPLRDPKASDVVEFGSQWQRERYEVYATHRDTVWYVRKSGPGETFSCQLSKWREWNESGGEVINAAAE